MLDNAYWRMVEKEFYLHSWGGYWSIRKQKVSAGVRFASSWEDSLGSAVERIRKNLSPYWLDLIYRNADCIGKVPKPYSSRAVIDKHYRFLGFIDGSDGKFYRFSRLHSLSSSIKESGRLLGITISA